MKSSSVTVKLPDTVKVRLDRLARATHRSRSSLIASAIEEMLSVEEWQIQGIEDALQEADSDKLITHDEIKHEWKTRRARQVDK